MKGRHSLRLRLTALVLIAASIVITISCNKDRSTANTVQQQLTPAQQAANKAQDWLQKNHLLEKVSSIKLDNISVAIDFNRRDTAKGQISSNGLTPAKPPLTTLPPAPVDGYIKWADPAFINTGCKPMLAIPYQIDRPVLSGAPQDLPIEVVLIVKPIDSNNYQIARKITTSVLESVNVNGLPMAKSISYEYYFDLSGKLLEAWRNDSGKYEYLDLISPSIPTSPVTINCSGTLTVPFTAMVGCDETSTCTFVYGTRTIGCDRRQEDWGDFCKKLGGGVPSGSGAASSTEIPKNDGIYGPKICKGSFVFMPQGSNSIVNVASVWAITATYQTSSGEMFNLIFGEQVFAPNNIKESSWGFWSRMASQEQYGKLWRDGDIVEAPNGGGYNFSKYAQQEIAADATDYASYNASLAAKNGIDATGYKMLFKKYFMDWVNQYYPGAIVNVLNSNITGATFARLTDGDTRNCK
jgi:hypothetical protein